MAGRFLAAAAAMSVFAAGFDSLSASAASAPQSWDGLSRASSKRFEAVYLLPGADFRSYRKVMLDATEVAFERNWLRDYNTRNPTARIGDSEARRILDEVRTGFETAFRNALTEAGHQITDTPGADVIRVRTGVVNLNLAAPDRMTAGRSTTFTRDAGRASLIIEARDSVTGALLGRAVDTRTIGQGAPYRRTSASNMADVSRQFGSWAKGSVAGIAELKARSPVGAGPASAK
jgi:hypothetical protein